MDNLSEKHILDCIKELDLICIVISHRLSTIGHFDRIIVINDGKVEEEGTHEHLIHNRGLYSQIYMNECNQRIAMDGFCGAKRMQCGVRGFNIPPFLNNLFLIMILTIQG